ncbi:transmembrane protein 56-A-like [Acanthaster planci]|uniref:Transmembrane protein 56-A-like n=1 Tax=Acanthaster planci TaxID=133434 RepID=A0A8B7Y412_ACAPL|nr:transmembrane protein 56-A-like [Acanthaster planci]
MIVTAFQDVMEIVNVTEQRPLEEFSSEYLPALVASFLIFFAMMFFACPRLSAKYVPTYSRLSDFEKADWNTRISSNINAVIVSIVSVYLLVTDDAINADKIWGTSYLARVNICIISGFLLADLVMMLRWFPLGDSWQYIIHHFFVLYPFLNNVVYGALTFFANFRITTECSTLFVNIRWFMTILGHKSSKWYIANGTLMAVVFFLCRIILIPVYYACVYQEVAQAVASLPMRFIIAWLPSGMVMDVLNTYWFRKIYRGAKKALWGQSKPKGPPPIRNRVKGE